VDVRRVVPILNVSDVRASIAWFQQLGWATTFEWSEREDGVPSFAGVTSGHEEIFLCLDGQGGEAWHSWWLERAELVDKAYAQVLELGYEVSREPADEPWGVREFHLRHPDGHTFRVSAPAR
jgi:uncharacterized glyoxalase superfamily protein PhnB